MIKYQEAMRVALNAKLGCLPIVTLTVKKLNDKIVYQGNRIMKISKDQPWRAWAFVIGLNLVGFIGWYLIQGYDLHQ